MEEAREKLRIFIGAESADEIIFTAGATEANNLAIKGCAHFNQRKGKHIITSRIEHKAVLDTCRQLEREGFEVTYLDPDSNGLIQPSVVANAIREDTTVVSIMHVNNELGTLNDIAAIGKICREQKVFFHVDAAQSAGKTGINVEEMYVDMMSFSAHKIYGLRALARCLCDESLAFELKLRCMVVAMNVVCVLVPYQPIKLLGWERRSRLGLRI